MLPERDRERERPTDTIFVKSIRENYPLKNSSFFSPSTQAHLKLLCWLVSLLGIFQLQEVLNGKHSSCRPPQLRPRLHLVISAALSLCLLLSPCPACWVWENSVWETLSWTLGHVPLPAFHSWVHWHEGRLWNGVKTTLGKHREKAHFWLASHPALKSQRQGFKEQRNSGEEMSLPLVSSPVRQLEALHALLLKETKATQQSEAVPSDFLPFPEIRGYRENTNGI